MTEPVANAQGRDHLLELMRTGALPVRTCHNGKLVLETLIAADGDQIQSVHPTLLDLPKADREALIKKHTAAVSGTVAQMTGLIRDQARYWQRGLGAAGGGGTAAGVHPTLPDLAGLADRIGVPSDVFGTRLAWLDQVARRVLATVPEQVSAVMSTMPVDAALWAILGGLIGAGVVPPAAKWLHRLRLGIGEALSSRQA